MILQTLLQVCIKKINYAKPVSLFSSFLPRMFKPIFVGMKNKNANIINQDANSNGALGFKVQSKFPNICTYAICFRSCQTGNHIFSSTAQHIIIEVRSENNRDSLI
jgi:hypothetical protein